MRRVQILSGKSSGTGEVLGPDNDLDDPMERLLSLESGVGSVANSACYTCAIEKPLRSRHCRNCRRCVRAFDHHCPFIGNCVGAGNYRWFFFYIICLLVRCVPTCRLFEACWSSPLGVAVSNLIPKGTHSVYR